MTNFPPTPGHVFVIHGDLTRLDADAVIIPTDADFVVEKTWDSLVDPHVRPAKWKRGSWSTTPVTTSDGIKVFYLDVALHHDETPGEVMAKIREGVKKILTAVAAKSSGRHGRKPRLVALPALGTGEGGLDSVRGRLIKSLLESVIATAAQTGVDVAIVAYGSSDFAAFQHVRFQFVDRSLDWHQDAKGIADHARAGRLSLFIGAGASISAGLPSWEGLIRKLTEDLKVSIDPHDNLNPLDLAQLLFRKAGKEFVPRIMEIISAQQTPSLTHYLLAGLSCDEVVTTNFDKLYEDAANHESPAGSVTTLPWNEMGERRPWVLKMHGDVDHSDDIVLTRSDFVGYDAGNTPVGAVVQSLFMTRHLLVVGASLTDDNFLRLAYEVEAFRRKTRAKTPIFGTVLSIDSDRNRAQLYSGLFDWVNVRDSLGEPGTDGPRALAIFLDMVGMYASKRSSFLLDPRYKDLLNKREASLAVQATALFESIRSETTGDVRSAWQPILEALASSGAQHCQLQKVPPNSATLQDSPAIGG